MSEVKTQVVASTHQHTGREVLFFIESKICCLGANWQWNLHAEALFCSDVMWTLDTGQHTRVLLHPDDKAAVKKALANLQNGKEPSLQFRVITSYGEVATVTATAPFSYEILESLPAATDTASEWAEKRWLQQQLDDVSRQFRSYHHAEEVNGIGHWWYNSITGKVWYSDGVFRLFKIPAQSLNPHLLTFQSFLHPDDRAIVTEVKAESIQKQLPFQMEYRIVCSNGTENLLREFCRWEFNDKGQPVLYGSFFLLNEMAALEQKAKEAAEELATERKKLRLAEETAGIGIYEVNLFTRQAWVSDSYYRLLGLKPGSKPASVQTLFDQVHPDDRAEVQKTIVADFAAHQITEMTFRLARPDGKVRTVRRKGRVLTNEKGQPVAIGILQDITRQLVFEKELEKTRADLQRLQLGQLLQDAATNSATWYWNLTDNTIRTSGSLWQLLGTRPDATGFSWLVFLRLVLEEDRLAVQDCLKAATLSTDEQRCRFRLLRKGELRHFEAVLQQKVEEKASWLMVSLRDVTEMHHLQKELEGREKFAQSLADNTVNYILVSDVNHQIQVWNRSFEQTFGIPREKALRRNLFEVFPALQSEAIIGDLNRALAGETVMLENYRLVGTKEIVNIHLSPIHNNEGTVTGVLHVLQNTSREFHLRKQLSQRLAFIENLLEHSVDRIIVLDRNLNYQYWNRRAEDYYGITRNEVIGQNILELFPAFATDPSYPELRRVLRGETVYIPAQETLAEKKRYYETYLVPLKTEMAEVSGILWIVHDLTKEYHLQEVQKMAQRQLEAEHRRLKEAQAIGRVGSFDWTVGDSITYWSDELYRIHALEPQSEAITNEKVAAFIHPDDADRLQNLEQASLHTPGKYKITHRIRLRNGEERWVNHQWETIPDETGTVVRVSGIVQDITEQQKAEEQLRERTHYLRRIQETVPDMISITELATRKFTYLNTEAFFADGFDPENLNTKSPEELAEIIHPEDRPAVATYFQKLSTASDDEVATAEYRAKDDYDQWKTFFVRGRVFQRDAAGTVTHVLNVIENITERKKTEEEVKTSRQLLKTTIDSTPDMIQVFEAVRNNEGEIIDFRYILLNEEAEKWMPGALGQSLLQRQPGVVQEGIFDAFKQVVETGLPQQYEKHYVHEQFNGWFHQSVMRLDDGVATTTTDITARKKNENEVRIARQSLQATLDSSPYVIQAFKAVRNAGGTIVDFTWIFTNHSWNKLYGDVIGKSLLEQNPGVVETGLFEKFIQVTETGIVIDHEQYYSHEQFHEQWFHQTLVKMGDGFVMNTEDITERKKSEAEILRLKDEIAQKATDKYKALFDSIDEGFAILEVVTDERGKVIDVIYREVNSAFEQHTGMKDALGKKVSEAVPHIEQAFLDDLTQVYQTGKPLRSEGYTVDLDRWFSYHYSQIGGAGSPLIAVVFNDISQRKRREEQQEYLLLLNDALRPLMDPVEVQRKAMEVLGTHLKVDRVVYSDINIDDDYFEIHDNYAAGSVQKITGRFPYSAFGDSTEKNKNGETLVIHDVTVDVGDDNEKAQFFAMNMQAVVAVPLIKNGKLVMNLAVHQTTPRQWRADEIVLIEETAERTWAAVERAKAEKALRENEGRLQRISISLEQQVAERTKELHESASFVQEITQTTPDRITIHDAATREILYTNHPHFWKELYGNNAIYQGVKEQRAIGLVHPDEAERFRQFLEHRNSLADGEVSEIKLRLKGDKWVHIRSKVFKRDEQGAATQIISFTTDITEQVKAEKEIETNLAILQHTEALAQIGSWEYNIATGDFTWSEGMYRIFGLPNSMRVKPETYLDFAVEEDRSVAKRIVKNLRKAYQSFEETMQIRRGDSLRLLRIKGSVVKDEAGHPQKLIGVDLDITDLREAEKKVQEYQHWLEQTALASPDAITIYNLVEKQPVYLNSCLANWLGTTNEDLVKMGIDGRLQLIHPDDRLRVLHFNEKIKAVGDDELLSLEYRLRRKDDSLIWIRNRSKVFQRDARGNVTHLLSVLQDVTETKASERVLKTLNANLEKKAQELESANEEITSFAFVASHDLKEPLRKIHTFTNLLLTQETMLSEAGRKNLEKLDSSVNRLNLLINDVLTLTKVHVENEKPAPTDLNRLLERLQREMQGAWAGATIEVGSLPAILGMENQLFYLFKNLISNGVKFQEKGNVPLIRIAALQEDGYQKITVSDNGIGIEPDYHKKIFEIFRRLHSRTEYEGTGMGLSICKKIMEKHGGKITVESSPGKGTVFTCWFPLSLSTS